MTFNFKWQDPNEMSAFKILQEGEASFKVQDVIETTSKKTGEEMLKVVLLVTDSKGDSSLVDDYILSSAPWKLYNLCKAINRPEVYHESSDGKLNTMKIIAEKGRCKIKTDKPVNPNFQDRTIISGYIDATKNATKEQAAAELAQAQANFPDDKLPF